MNKHFAKTSHYKIINVLAMVSLCGLLLAFIAVGLRPALAQSSNYVSLGNNLYNDFNSIITYSSDYCIGQWDNGALLTDLVGIGGWTVNNAVGWQCPTTSTATLDIFTGSGSNFPNNVYYNSITVYSNEPWSGNVDIFKSDLHASPAYFVVSQQSIENSRSYQTDNYTQYATVLFVNQVFDAPWGIRFSTDRACPFQDFRYPLVFSSGCPTITAVRVNFQPLATNTPPPTHTLPPTWTPNSTFTVYPTFTPGPADTLAPTGTLVSTLSLSRHSIPGLITPTDYPCNVAAYVYQQSNNLGTPCGAVVSFATLALPTLNLPSPTLIALQPTNTAQAITATPSSTATPTITPTPSRTGTQSGGGSAPSPTFGIDMSSISNLATSINASVATLMPLGQFQVSVNGTPQGIVSVANNAGNAIGGVIVFAREMQMTGMDAGGIISLAISVLIFTVGVRLFTFVAPLLIYLFKLILNVIQTILTPV